MSSLNSFDKINREYSLASTVDQGHGHSRLKYVVVKAPKSKLMF